ncbi:MAG: hypothetical protein ACKVQB_00795 [Bacteroidia bacterium]
MKYYSFGVTNELNIIGFYPQTQRAKGFHVDEYNFPSDSFPEFEPKFGLELNSKSIATDILDKSPLDFGQVVNDKLKSILEQFNLPPHKFYSIDVHGSTTRYFWFHYITNFGNFIDFKMTEIEIYHSTELYLLDTVKFNSYNELMDYKRSIIMQRGKATRFGKIFLKDTFPNYDLFEISGASYSTIISEKLKLKLEMEDITGFETLEYNRIITTPNSR